MTSKFTHKRNLLCAAISLSLLPIASTTLAQDDGVVEEVIVTGSYIRRTEGFTQASSMQQLTAEDLEAEGTMNLGEVIQNLSFVGGEASAITNTFQGPGTDERSTQIDLRGLGASSTLTLLDGKRLANQNVNALIPSIALQRLDIVADGAAALYGNEAVAGVVNFVPYKSYDGFRIETHVEGDSRGDYDEHSAQFLWGGDVGGVDIVLAGQFRQAARLAWDERPELANSSLSFSSQANPGTYWVPNRDANGNYLGDSSVTGARTRLADLGCGEFRDPLQDGTIASPRGFWSRNADGSINPGLCRYEFGDNHSLRNPYSSNHFYGNATWEVNDDLTLSAQGFFTRMSQTNYGSTSNPGNARAIELPAIRGEHPANPYWATNSLGQQLYGIDNNGDGLPDRGSMDMNNDGLMDYILSGGGGLTDTGLPLHEDVVVASLRLLAKHNTLTGAHGATGDNPSGLQDENSRWSVQADFRVPFLEGWEGLAAYSHSERNLDFLSNQNYDITDVIQGLNCDVLTDIDKCYSPFVSDTYVMSQNVVDAIGAREREWTRDELKVFDLVINGELSFGGFELPGGPIGAALGFQRRDEFDEAVPSAVEIAGDAYIGEPRDPVTGAKSKEQVTFFRRDVDAYFAELSLPVLDTLEIQAAVRHEDFSTGQESTDPKYGITWQPLEWLTLRGTKGDAFIAPSLNQLNAPSVCGLGEITDRFGPFSGFVTRCQQGNPILENESSESESYGFDLEFGEFSFHATYSETDFTNRIITALPLQIIELDFFNFQQATGFTGDGVAEDQKPSLAQLQSWLGSGQSDERIIRNPADPYEILRVNTGSTNASSVVVKAYDVSADYNFDLGFAGLDDWGDFRLNLRATNVDSFQYQETALTPVVEGLGKQNFATGAAPALPEWKANLRLGWSRGNHSATATVHYIDEISFDGNDFSFIQRYTGITYRDVDTITRWVDLDIAYSYRDLDLFGGSASFTAGMRNATDRAAQKTTLFGGVIGELQDPLGRMVYARVAYEF
ncbi:MAG: TonB-dependent receptor plug domain-containing protein [Pseudomonadales bacterium]|nr:TonB-dependent receptor plug domain-containing protein [Pseudomonadales bacterium]